MAKEDKDDCVFCKILSKEFQSSPVYQDSYCSAFMDIEPVNPGHVLIIPSDHVPYLSDVDSDVAGHLFKVGQKISAAIRKSGLRCEGINFFLADGEAAMQEVFHVHLHVFPRFANDGFGFKYGEHNFTKPDRSELDRAAESIRKFL